MLDGGLLLRSVGPPRPQFDLVGYLEPSLLAALATVVLWALWWDRPTAIWAVLWGAGGFVLGLTLRVPLSPLVAALTFVYGYSLAVVFTTRHERDPTESLTPVVRLAAWGTIGVTILLVASLPGVHPGIGTVGLLEAVLLVPLLAALGAVQLGTAALVLRSVPSDRPASDARSESAAERSHT